MTAKLPGKWTSEKLEALTPKDRNRTYESVKATRMWSDDERAVFIEALLSSGPVDDRTALTRDNPFLIRMDEIIRSPEGRAACTLATEQGLPALAGVEPMLALELGEEYGRTYMSTQNSGGFVGMMMRELNYQQVGRQKMPEGSVAKTAAVWRKRG